MTIDELWKVEQQLMQEAQKLETKYGTDKDFEVAQIKRNTATIICNMIHVRKFGCPMENEFCSCKDCHDFRSENSALLHFLS